MEETVGYFSFWYWYVFAFDDGTKLMNDNVESLFDAAHGPPESWMDILCRKNGTEECVSRGKRQRVLDYATPEMRARFVERLSRDKFDGPQCWYKAQMHIVYEWEQRTIGQKNVVEVPALFIGGKKYCVCLTGAIYGPQKEGLLPDLTIEEIDAGHWCMLAQPRETGEALVKWLESKF